MDPRHKKDQNKKGKKPTNGIGKQIGTINLEWPEHITEIDLSSNNLLNLEENVKFPSNLISLNISHNALSEVPDAILNLNNLKNLDLSYNKIVIFDDRPKFSLTIEKLNLSYNDLIAPPYWLWVDSPPKLTDIDLSFNIKITSAIDKDYLQELCQNQTAICNVKINNCNITTHLKLLSTWKAKILDIGSDVLSLYSANRVIEVPCEGLIDCCDIERLRLGNTYVYYILPNIDIFSSLIELNLSLNYISSLPDEFCNLPNLEICILSMNQLLYLPEGIGKMKKLSTLHVNNNELCMLPESITDLENLRCLDLYDNCLYEIPNELIKCVPEIDLAQNYCEEPDDDCYIEKREKLRLDLPERYEGRKKEVDRPVSSCSSHHTEDEEYFSSGKNEESVPEENERASSPEDWDSDDYWVPIYAKNTKPTSNAHWLCFIKKKMEEGNFCPMDAHQVSIAEKVKYEKLNCPNVVHESDGQFDDYSDDNC